MDAIAALLPSVGLLVLFILLMRSILHADRRERRAAARAEAEHRAATGAEKAQDSSGAS
ncbi:hypothetical protein [Kineococcus terrestris]|uniref:hypothetical protein n=1 Tax=Kineococcus terrestris TaxID=2044856 RepID=UPI0034DB62EE